MKAKSQTGQKKFFEMVWSEQLVRSACIRARSAGEARARWLGGDGEIWDCPKDWGAEPIRYTLEIKQLGGGERCQRGR